MIEIRGVSKRYRGKTVLDGVDASIPSGEITFLMGANGAGKTTLIKAILGLETFDGSITFDNAPLEQAYGAIGVVFDDSPLYPRLSGFDNIRLLCSRRVTRDEIRQRATYLSDLELGRPAGSCSYGQQKKIAIAAALLGNPRYLIMDEVSNGLDYETMQWLRRELRCLSENTCVLLTGHQFDFYDRIVDRVLVLDAGKITEARIESVSRPESALGSIYEGVIGGVGA